MPQKSGWDRTKILNTLWQRLLRPIPKLAMNATVQFIDSPEGLIDYDPATGAVTSNAVVIADNVAARIQPYSYPVQVNAESPMATNLQSVRLQIPIDTEFDTENGKLGPNTRARVVACAQNPRIVGLTYFVFSATDSSNPIELTLIGRLDSRTTP